MPIDDPAGRRLERDQVCARRTSRFPYRVLLDGSSPRQELSDHDHEGDDQQDVDEPATN